jgi:hypothetical protein
MAGCAGKKRNDTSSNVTQLSEFATLDAVGATTRLADV